MKVREREREKETESEEELRRVDKAIEWKKKICNFLNFFSNYYQINLLPLEKAEKILRRNFVVITLSEEEREQKKKKEH